MGLRSRWVPAGLAVVVVLLGGFAAPHVASALTL
jgi:hypothetical protein